MSTTSNDSSDFDTRWQYVLYRTVAAGVALGSHTPTYMPSVTHPPIIHPSIHPPIRPPIHSPVRLAACTGM